MGVTNGDWPAAGSSTYKVVGAFVPQNLLFLNPLLWLRADLGVTLVSGKASVWADQSGNGNDATQGTAGNRFTFSASSLNGQAGMTGTTGTGMNLATGVFTAGQQRWLLAVVKAAASGGGVVLSTRTAAKSWTACAGNVGAGFTAYSDLATRTLDTSPLYTYDGNGHTIEWASTLGSPLGFVIDGATKTLANSFGSDPTVSTDDGGAAAAQVGFCSFNPGIGFAGDILEIAAGTGVLSGSQLTQWRSYAHARYGL